MKSRRNLMFIGLLLLAVLLMLSLAFSPYIDAFRANRHLDVGGVKLLMSLQETDKRLGTGTELGGFGGDFYRYQGETVTIVFNSDGMLKQKVSYIETSNTEHSVFGIHPGDSAEEAMTILIKQGFKEDEAGKGHFKRGSVRISLYSSSVRINIRDWTLAGRIY